MRTSTKGVVLCNMGGPDTLDDVRPFLYNLFSDRDIIRLGPPFMQKALAWLISRRRAPKSREIYEKIGGGSPLKKITTLQAEALERTLRQSGDYRVTIAMRYWPPSAGEAIDTLLAEQVDQITALTLYPHYSQATTGSSFRQLRKCMQQSAPEVPLTTIDFWPQQASYIHALAANITEGLASFGPAPTEVVYSAHSLPVSFIEAGDPYVIHLEQTIQAIEERTGHKGRLCYQSRSGPVEWLSPSTPEMIETLAGEGCKNILMVPISFVSDHVETLYEINILYREMARSHGINLQPCRSLNTDPLFIEGLKELILNAG